MTVQIATKAGVLDDLIAQVDDLRDLKAKDDYWTFPHMLWSIDETTRILDLAAKSIAENQQNDSGAVLPCGSVTMDKGGGVRIKWLFASHSLALQTTCDDSGTWYHLCVEIGGEGWTCDSNVGAALAHHLLWLATYGKEAYHE